ncbi:MAG: hypothetical protein KTR18_04725 [Acidiferrobacterales bacterium]|nr:hypothetical protein [Acidiferrobacterales bacterium]
MPPTLAIVSLALSLIATGQVHARDWYFEPAVSVSAGYEENPLLISSGSEGTISTGPIESMESIEPEEPAGSQSYIGVGVDLAIHAASPSDRYTIELGAESRQYESSELDTNLVDASMEYIKNLESSSYDLGISYAESTTFETGFTDTDISLVGADLIQQTVGLSAGYTRQINTRLSTDISAQYSDVGFESDSENLTEFVEYKQTSLAVDLAYSLAERLDFLYGFEFSMYRPDTDTEVPSALDQDTLSLTLGLEFALRENLIAQFSVAPTYRDIEGGEDSEDTTTTQYDLGLTYTGFQSSVTAGFSRSLSPSARGGLIQSDNFSLEWNRPNQYDGAFSAAIAYGEQVDDEGEEGDISSSTFETAYSRAVNRRFTWVVRYRYREQSTVDEGTIDSNDISFQFQYNWGRIAIPMN